MPFTLESALRYVSMLPQREAADPEPPLSVLPAHWAPERCRIEGLVPFDSLREPPPASPFIYGTPPLSPNSTWTICVPYWVFVEMGDSMGRIIPRNNAMRFQVALRGALRMPQLEPTAAAFCLEKYKAYAVV